MITKNLLITSVAIGYIGCIIGYSENMETAPCIKEIVDVKNIKTLSNIIDTQKTQEVTTNNINIDNNNSKKQLSIKEQLDKKISELNNLFKTTSIDNKQMKNELKKLEAKYSKVDPNSIPNEINTKIGMLRNKTSNLTNTLVNLETAIRILQELKNTDVFQKMIDFVRSNSKELIDGKIVDFTTVFEQIKDKVNEVYDIESLDTQSLLMATALSMCPELKVEHIFKFNNDGIFFDGIKINNNENIYGFEFNKRFHLGIDKTWDIDKKCSIKK